MANEKNKNDIKFNFNPKAPLHTLVLRETDQVPEIRQPVKPRITGDLFAPGKFFKLRIEQELIDLKKCHVEVDRHNGKIKFYQNVRDCEDAIVTGSLDPNPDIRKLGINEGKTYDKDGLIKMLKLNRHLFEEVDVNMELVSKLQNLSMSVDQKIERKDDYRGGRADVLRQTVESDLHKTFNLEMSVYRNSPKAVFEVELCFSVQNGKAEFWMASPDLAEMIENHKEDMLEEALEPFDDADIVMIEK